MITKLSGVAFLICLIASVDLASAQPAPTPPPATVRVRPTPPTRDPSGPGFVTAKELPDGANPQADVDGNFIIGPTHKRAPEMAAQDGVPQGIISTFTM